MITKRNIWIALCLVIIIWNIARVLLPHASSYTQFDYWKRFPELKRIYNQSQYVNKHPTGWIPDETVNAYAGGAYMKGVPPILIAPDTPPMGRYFIGLSALIFDNENVGTLIFFIGALVLLYFSTFLITKSPGWSLVPVVITSFDPLVTNQLVYTPLLDIMQLVFLLGGLYAFSVGFTKRSGNVINYVIAGICLGLFIATKFFGSGITIVAAWLGVLILQSKYRQIRLLIPAIFVAVVILLASYSAVFSLGYSLKQFLGIQKWVYAYHQSQLILPFSVWPLIFLNHWYVWYGNKPIISDPQWNLLWPISTLSVIILGILGLFKKVKLAEVSLPFIVWAWVYLVFLSMGQTTARYLVIFMPVAYIIGTYSLFLAVLYIRKHRKVYGKSK